MAIRRSDLPQRVQEQIAAQLSRSETAPKATDRIVFFVDGLPRTAGSKRAFFNRKTGRSVIVDASGAEGTRWQDHVAAVTRQVIGRRDPMPGAAALTLHFFLPRPDSHFRTGRNRHMVRLSAPEKPTGKPDLTKMLRAVEDGITKALVAWKDDAQVTDGCQKKRYVNQRQGERPGVRVTIEPA
ncbi:MAG: RusA family crossover junction endodeoxyribonuclease [Phycisphaerae bacterium]|nr:RusA family crossover junction endodeoxyribonuclease [Phycisphaerae bacterium]